MTSVNERFRQVVNLAGQVSELNTAELECGTLKTSSLLANSVRPRLSNGVVKSVDYSVASTAATAINEATTGITIPAGSTLLKATMKSNGTIVTAGDFKLGDAGNIITLNSTSIDATVVNSGGVLGEPITPITGEVKVSAPKGDTAEVVTVSGTVTYFEPN